MRQEWSGLVDHFYHNLQEYPRNIRTFIARVRAYAANRPGFSSVQLLITEAYQGSVLWRQYLSGIQHELSELGQAGTPRVPRARPDPPPGIPLGEQYAAQAQEELDLSPEDAAQAVRFVHPTGGRVRVEGYHLPLYHETVHSRAGAGVRNLTGTARVITFFYVQTEAGCFLVARGIHVDAPHNRTAYRIVRQARNVTGTLEGETVTFS